MTIAPAERVETSLEEIAALDFEPPCEAPSGCDSSAAFITVNPCCGAGGFICSFHESRARVAILIAPNMTIGCNKCRAHFPLGETRIIPIKAKP